MSEFPLHRHYLHYSELPYSQRVLYTATLLILGMGYLFALLNVYFTYAGRAGGNPMMLSYEDIVVAYSGSGKGSRLESALRGPMSTMLPADERNTVLILGGRRRPASRPTTNRSGRCSINIAWPATTAAIRICRTSTATTI